MLYEVIDGKIIGQYMQPQEGKTLLTEDNAQVQAALAAETQAAATRASSEQAAKATQDAAKQTAMQASQTAARNAALEAASNATETAVANPDVQLAATAESATGTAKKRREKFGIGSKDTGVNI